MKKFLKGGKMFLDIILLLLGMVKLVIRPNDISPIFRGRSFRNHKSMQMALDSLKSKPEVLALMQERYLAPKPYDLDELMKLPEGSLGRVYAEHMRKNKLEVVFYPPLEDKVDDDIAYMRKRARQTHDIHHVVLGFPAVDIGEMAISGFYLSQNRIPLSALLIGTGFFLVALKQPHRVDELVNAVIKGWTTGKKAKDFLGIRWEEYFNTPIEQVRKEVNVEVEEGFFERISAGEANSIYAGEKAKTPA